MRAIYRPVSQKLPEELEHGLDADCKKLPGKNREVSLQQLVKENNYLQLLEKSDYRP
jgi:hypothetical protein